MKKTILVMAIAMITSSFANAQNKGQHTREQMQQHRAERLEKRIKKLSERMELTAEQKEKFAVLYKQMTDEIIKKHVGTHPQNPRIQGNKEKQELTEQEAQEKLQKRFERREQELSSQQEILEIQKKYSKQMAEFLSAKQLLKAFSFRQHVQQKGMRHRGEGQRMENHKDRKHAQSHSRKEK